MFIVFFWAILFSVITAASITFLGSRDLISGHIDISRIIKIILDWRFILGATLAFGSRLLFIMTNNAIHKIPSLSESSTTITTLINSMAIILVIIANYYFLHEKISATQGIGAFMIIAGIFLISK